MRVHLILIICLLMSIAHSQESKVIPSVTTLEIEEGTVTPLHLSPGYTTSVRLPEEISSVVIGNPATFKAEHSEAEPRLVFLKPITAQPSESNALITTKSGQEITLHLVSGGKAAANSRVDFLVEYRRPHSFLVGPSDRQSFLIAETRPLMPATSSSPPRSPEKPDLVARELEKQKSLSTPAWEGKEVLAAVGASVKRDHQTVLTFSILNSSNRTIELLPPQVELTGTGHGNGGKRIKAEPVAVSEYRMTTRRLAPGERADGVVVFERPTFKESSEKLQLQLAQAERVDRPILLPVPFTADSQGGTQ
jgi:Protein of unknown function (DUF2381)